MTKYIKLSMITAMAVFSIVGCGSSSSSSSSPSSVETGTGYYVDSAVEGVKYECGTMEGTTGDGGKFTFEKEKGCTFSLAGIHLRTTEADDLWDGVKVLEDDNKTIQFLQSLDDANDGTIAITPELIKALEDEGIATIPDDEGLYKLTKSLAEKAKDDENFTFNGGYVSLEEAQQHLTQTQTEITKGLLAGKTFYVVGEDDSIALLKIVVNKEGTSFSSYKLDDTFIDDSDIEILGNKMIFKKDNDNSYTLISQKDGYVLADDRNADGTKDGIGHRLYASQSDAKDYLISNYIIGKTYYITTDDSYTDENGNTINNAHVETLNFNIDGKTLNITWTENEETKSYTMSYSISNGTLTIKGTDADGKAINESLGAPVIVTSDYISFSGHDGRFFKTYNAAEVALESAADALQYFKFTTEYLNGKTLYNVYEECDTYDNQGKCTESNPKWEMSVFSFTDTTFSAYEVDNPNEKIENVEYSITSEGYITFLAPWDNNETEYIKVLEATDDYIRLDWTNREESLNTDRYDEYFYFDENKAKSFLAEKNNS